MSDITKSKDSTLLSTLYHRIHGPLLYDIHANNLSPSTSKDNGQQSSNLDNRITNNRSLKLSILIQFFLSCSFRILSHHHQLIHHVLDRLNDICLDISVKHMNEGKEDDTDKQSLGHRKEGIVSVVLSLI